MSYEIADLLDGAADVIERDGWHQGDFYPGAAGFWGALAEKNGLPKCARGAINSAASTSNNGGGWIPSWARKTAEAADALGAVIGCPVPHWNDAPERTKREVLDTLRLAAKEQRRAEDGAA